ncbi:helix-turn-helix domain-containing protein [Phaeovibrio sulfidiphilus]|uniref:Helix-turn-helix domain-containing protein n=1 Tax=Phaeovibrio sulfidiphilus TaxID=1220600 RepID=A0A8J6Z0I2_9PROT|nr:helix-turn-helix transcriptional regulator [Phaeovibrio sulfidiphilus]MBE1237673.1 helix-turn-helix domain-containing protein [Phaeovibrio sulfidiphilus]
MSDLRSSFRERIETLITLYNGNAMKLARDTGVTRSALEKWRKGLSEASRESLEKLARGAGVSLTWLVTGDGDMFPGSAGAHYLAADPGQDCPPVPHAPGGASLTPDPVLERFLDMLEFLGPDLEGIASRARVSRTRITAFRSRETVPTGREREALVRAAGVSSSWIETGLGMMIAAHVRPGERLPRVADDLPAGPSLISDPGRPGGSGAPIDPEGLAVITDHLELLYREKGLPCSAGVLARRAAEIAQDVALVARDPADAEIAVSMALLTIRRTL